ncbi:MAG TPA: hypothetical protein VHE13_07220 [Opitutus sp.]|nr:hypothetical protein [Opitutus sp.]
MKLQRQSRAARARATLSDKLLAYSIATSATVAATSSADAQTTLDAGYFGGSLPTVTFSSGLQWYEFQSPVNFQIGAANFNLGGFKSRTTSSGSPGYPGSPPMWFKSTNHYSYPVSGYTYYSPGSPGSPGNPGWDRHYGGIFLGASGALNLKINGAGFTGGYIFRSQSGSAWSNRLGGSSGVVSFQTAGGGSGSFTLHLGFDGSGPSGASGLVGGSFLTAVPEPSAVAYGLGLVALGYAGVREHRRRRAASPAAAKP